MTDPGYLLQNKYELVRLIGRGGMGQVWEGIHLALNKKVAVKFIKATDMDDSRAFMRLAREAKNASSINHPAIIEVFDFDESEDGMPYMVMELLEGESLEDRLHREGRIGPDEAIRILTVVLQALEMAHEKGVVHRDLKPDNIFLTRDGNGGGVKILDFGISKLTSEHTASKLTQSGSILGTPYYMSPEIAKGGKDVDRRVDVYAMGAILYECLTGNVPFDGTTYNEVFYKIVSKDLDIESEFEKLGIAGGLAGIVARAMEKEPSERYQTCGEFLADLTAYFSDSKLPTMAMVPPAVDIPVKRSRLGPRTRILLGALAAVLLIAGAGVAVIVASGRNAPTEARAPDREPAAAETEPATEKAAAGLPEKAEVAAVEPEAGQEAPPAKDEKPAAKKTVKKPPSQEQEEEEEEKQGTLKKAGHATTVETKFE